MSRAMFFGLLCACFVLNAAGEKKAKLVNNGYEGVVIAISNEVPEDEALIDEIKNMMTSASNAMYRATQYRAHFKEITILVPKTWTGKRYQSAGNETYDSADIRIAPPRPQLGDNPYAWGYGSCGKQGIYIHFTPAYVTDDSVSRKYGQKGRVVVHEWAHYRWGVKDEYPTGGTTQEKHENSFYLHSTGGVEATRCSLSIRGRHGDGNNQCRYNPKTRLPLLGCKFQRYATQTKDLSASLMYMPKIDKVTMFCHDDPSDPTNMHNKEAPNNQNRQCDQKSAWQVIMDSVDFQNGERNIPGSANRNTVPAFRVVRAQQKRVVLVFDTSGSMAGEKLTNVKRVSEIFLKKLIPTGSYVGLVKFDSDASILHSMLEVKQDDDSRERLINALPTVAGGGTAIGKGIQLGVQALEEIDADGGHLFVLTDGEENSKPHVAEVADEVVNKNVKVHAIFFGLDDVKSDEPLVELSKRSSGEWYYSDEAVTANPELTSIFAALARPEDGDLSSASVQISSSVVTFNGNGTVNSKVAIDSSVGNQTTFIFTWSESEPTIQLKPPGSSCIYSNVNTPGVTYCGTIHETNRNTKTVTFSVPGTAKVGVWEYYFGNDSAGVTSITVTSAPSVEGVYPIIVNAELSLDNVSGSDAAVVVATVMQNTVPVLGATVTAQITRPIGDPVTLHLFDNGAGSDETKHDGVYSRYFSEFNSQGRYSVQITVLKDGNEPVGVANLPQAPLDLGKILDDGTFVPGPGVNNEPKVIRGAEVRGVLQRIATSTGLAYTGDVTDSDILPPNKITDLSVKQVDVDDADAGLRLLFTAPGDDYDSGTATLYDIRYMNGTSSALLTNFDAQRAVNLTEKPKSALSAEDFVIIPDISRTSTVVRIALAIRAFDEVDNPSEVSNVVVVTYFLEPPPPPPSSARSAFHVNVCVLIIQIVGTLGAAKMLAWQ